MPRSKEEIRDMLAKRLEKSVFDAVTFGDLTSAQASSDASLKTSILDAAKRRDATELGFLILVALDNTTAKTAKDDADTMLVNDNLDLPQLDQVLPE